MSPVPSQSASNRSMAPGRQTALVTCPYALITWILALATAIAGPALAQSGPVSSYQFETGTPGQVATDVLDSGPLGRNGTATGSPVYSSDVPSSSTDPNLVSLQFPSPVSGAASAVWFNSPFPFTQPGDCTIAFSMKSSFPSHGAVIWAGSDQASQNNTNFFQIFVNSDSTIGYNYKSATDVLHCLGTTCAASGGVAVPRNQWVRVALVRSGTTYLAYINGRLTNTGTDSNVLLPTATTWGFGARPGYPFIGLIDDVRLYNRALTAAEVDAGQASSQALRPGTVIMGSRTYGSVYGPVQRTGVLTRLISGQNLSLSTRPILGVGPSLIGGSLSLLAMPDGTLIAANGVDTPFGRYRIDPLTGDRTALPGTSTAAWRTGGEMLALDNDTFLAIADDYSSGPATADPKLFRYRLSTGEITLISGAARGDGPQMYHPRSIARLDANNVIIAELGEAAAPALRGSILFRVDLTSGDRSVLSTIAPQTPTRYTITGGVRSTATSPVPLRGAGPSFALGNRGVAVVGERIFVAGTADSTFAGGIVEVDPATGDRTLFGGAAILDGARISTPFGQGSDPYVADAPTALQQYSSRSFIFTDTFGPSRLWECDVRTRRIRILADLDPQFVATVRGNGGFSGLAFVPCNPQELGFGISQQPTATAACVNNPAVCTVASTGSFPFSYQWQIQVSPSPNEVWQTLTNDPNGVVFCPGGGSGTAFISPSNSPTVTITLSGCAATPGRLWPVRCMVSNACGSVTSDATPLAVVFCGCNPADVNQDGIVDGSDFVAFINSFAIGDVNIDALADVSGGGSDGFSPDGNIDGTDFVAFINSFAIGC